MDCAIAGWGTTNIENGEHEVSDDLLWAPIRIVEISPSRDWWIYLTTTLEDRSRLIAVGKPWTPLKGKKKYPRAAGGPGDSGGGLLCKHDGKRYVFGVMNCGTRSV